MADVYVFSVVTHTFLREYFGLIFDVFGAESGFF